MNRRLMQQGVRQQVAILTEQDRNGLPILLGDKTCLKVQWAHCKKRRTRFLRIELGIFTYAPTLYWLRRVTAQ